MKENLEEKLNYYQNWIALSSATLIIEEIYFGLLRKGIPFVASNFYSVIKDITETINQYFNYYY